MADANRTRLGYIRETTPGETPATPELTEVRITGESFANEITNTTSQEIRADRQITDLVQTSQGATGGFSYEFSFGTFDELIAAALQSASPDFDQAGDIVAISGTDIGADDGGTFTSGATDFTDENIKVGQWIKVDGFTATDSNGYFRVDAIAADTLTVSPAPGTTEAAGNTITMSGTALKNGVNVEYFTWEKGFEDITEFLQFFGMAVNTWSLNLQSQSIATGDFGFLGRGAGSSSATIDTSGTYTPAPGTEVMNAVGNVMDIREDGAAVDSPNFVTNMTVELNNNLRQQFAVGSVAAIGTGNGTCEITGTFTTYFGNRDFYEKFVDGSQTSLSFRMQDNAGNVYYIDMPTVKYQTGQVFASSQNSDVLQEFTYQALRDPGEGHTISITKIAA